MASKQVDLSEFFKHSRPKKKPCAVGFALQQLDEAAATQLVAACKHDPGLITNAAVQTWLSGRGHDASVSAIVAHRKGTCSCADQ